MKVHWLCRMTVVSVAALVASGAGCGEEAAPEQGADVAVVASSPLRAVLENELIPAFQRTKAGRGMDVVVSTGPSATQADAVVSGRRADVVVLSTMADMARLVDARAVRPEWQGHPQGDLAAVTAIALTFPRGNPGQVDGWEDVARPGVRVAVADPRIFDEGQWAALALWGSRVEPGGTQRSGRRFMERVLGSASIERGGPAAALRKLENGEIDVVIGYEAEALRAEAAGAAVGHVVPDPTIAVEFPASYTNRASPAGRSFYEFIGTERAQRLMVRRGLRPGSSTAQVATSGRFPQPEFFTVSTLKGWSVIQPRILAPRTGAVPRLLAARDQGD
jgi:sulfate transport system substrate-binding protein